MHLAIGTPCEMYRHLSQLGRLGFGLNSAVETSITMHPTCFKTVEPERNFSLHTWGGR
jgi:hypothetical protein